MSRTSHVDRPTAMNPTVLGSGSERAQEWVRLKSGRLYIGHATCQRHLAGIGSVVLLRRGNDLLVLPAHSAASGYRLEVHNAAGDRLVDAADFFREHGCEARERELPASWDAGIGAVLLADVFKYVY